MAMGYWVTVSFSSHLRSQLLLTSSTLAIRFLVYAIEHGESGPQRGGSLSKK